MVILILGQSSLAIPGVISFTGAHPPSGAPHSELTDRLTE